MLLLFNIFLNFSEDYHQKLAKRNPYHKTSNWNNPRRNHRGNIHSNTITSHQPRFYRGRHLKIPSIRSIPKSCPQYTRIYRGKYVYTKNSPKFLSQLMFLFLQIETTSREHTRSLDVVKIQRESQRMTRHVIVQFVYDFK